MAAGSVTLLALSESVFAQEPIPVAPTAPIAPVAEPAPAAAAPATASAATSADAEADALALSMAQGDDSTTSAVADVEEFKLNIYGFADFTYTAVLNDFAYASPYPNFMVGHLNLYAGAELGGGWRTLTEFRLLYVPHGNVPPSANPGVVPVRIDNSTADPADYGKLIRWGGVQIERAWLEYSAHPLLTIQGGQWLTPYGIWNVDHGSPVIIGVRRPYVVGTATLFPERQTGIQVYGKYLVGTTELGYSLGLSNGRGPVDQYADFDKNKAVTARLSVSNESALGTFTLGGTLFRGRYTDRTSRFYVSNAGQFGTEYFATASYDELGLAADLRWVFEDLTVQGEFIMRDTSYYREDLRPTAFQVAGVASGFVPDYRSTGWYAMAAYRLPWYNIMPFFGGESYYPGLELEPSAGAFWGGINWRPVPRVVIKAQFTQSFFVDDTNLVGADGLQALDFQAAWSF
jgi:hypothetical protein